MRPTKRRIAAFAIVYGAGILLLRSGGWWLPIAAKITGVEPGGHR